MEGPGDAVSWAQFEAAEPGLAGRVHHLFASYKHHTMATLRRDGSPRISGTEVEFQEGQLRLGMMLGARRALDLRRDPRLALHSHSVDPPEDDPSTWCGEAKVSGTAVEVGLEATSPDSHLFEVRIAEVVFTTVGSPADHLMIESWHQDRGVVRTERR